MKSSKLKHYLIIAIVMLFLLLPLLGITVYSFVNEWASTILPSGFTLHWYKVLWSNPLFITAFEHSIWICIASIVFSVLFVTPAIFVVHYYFPKFEKYMEILVLLPFALPPVVASIGLLNLYSNGPFTLVGSPWMLILIYVTIALPYIYRSIINNLHGINVHELLDAAHLLGSSTFRAFFEIVVPMLKKGLFISVFLSFSILIGEFVYAQMLVGSAYETLQVFIYNEKMGTSGHYQSAIVISYFAFTLLITLFATLLTNRKKS
ncbi:ABC transporter permease subunit [Vibrio sp. S4M6]|uniref:ABC transporter permease n=1 Tax=Vibrio sinus TaxID=2946865 RepID=UPI00202AC17F|nr:ABC transporter permease subunit [Vibrio sinus]MCL9780255.1 ABC transporter permease subunit [Vibrio sinus]